ncbi:hypothetical protein OCAE111667_06655 [Occultella aeris]|uniref:Uncharacterized protein n=1 Tax=Occultella aeris TaxID=2761496 RepID=A0A7M4DRW5_9MICO|nr:hypothetical protein HALOF300_04912 [Occultella aeris]
MSDQGETKTATELIRRSPIAMSSTRRSPQRRSMQRPALLVGSDEEEMQEPYDGADWHSVDLAAHSGWSRLWRGVPRCGCRDPPGLGDPTQHRSQGRAGAVARRDRGSRPKSHRHPDADRADLPGDAGAQIVRYFLGPCAPTSSLRTGAVPAPPLPWGLSLQVVHADDVGRACATVVARRAGGAFKQRTAEDVQRELLVGMRECRGMPSPSLRAGDTLHLTHHQVAAGERRSDTHAAGGSNTGTTHRFPEADQFTCVSRWAPRKLAPTDLALHLRSTRRQGTTYSRCSKEINPRV